MRVVSAASSSLPPRPAFLEISDARKRMSVNNCTYYFSHLNNSPQSHCDTIILKRRDTGISVLYKLRGVPCITTDEACVIPRCKLRGVNLIPVREKKKRRQIPGYMGARPGLRCQKDVFFCGSPPPLCTGVEFYDEEAGSTELKG